MKKLTEIQIKNISEAAAKELGVNASKDKVDQIVSQVIHELERGAPSIVLNQPITNNSGRIIITSFGKNSPGILFSITKVLHETNCDVLDVTQKIMQEFFTLMMIVDITNASGDFFTIKNKFIEVFDKIGIQIHVQHEDIFKAMHRI